MARDENPPFDRGHTWYDGETIDSSNLGGTHLEGKEWVFEDVNPSTGVARTGRSVRCRCVRNNSNINLLPKRLVQLEATAGQYSGRVIGLQNSALGRGYPVDEYLPTAGVPDNDLFWIVIEGPAVCVNAVAVTTGNSIGVGNWTQCQTNAASSQSTTDAVDIGRIGLAVTSGTSATGFQQWDALVGRALSAVATTGVTNQDVLVDVGKW
jgi:hypothetical protein